MVLNDARVIIRGSKKMSFTPPPADPCFRIIAKYLSLLSVCCSKKTHQARKHFFYLLLILLLCVFFVVFFNLLLSSCQFKAVWSFTPEALEMAV